MTPEVRLLAAVLVGLGLGYVLARGELCIVSALNQAILFRSRRVLMGLAVAAFVVAVGTSIALQVDVWPFRPGPVGTMVEPLVGGLLFGMGMAVAGGCVAGTLYRAGAGYVHFWLVLLAMMVGISLRELLPGRDGGGEAIRSLYDVIGSVPPAVIAGIAVVALAGVAGSRWRSGRERRRVEGAARLRGMPIEPWVAGLWLGALLLVQRMLVSPIGFTHGVMGATEALREGRIEHGVELATVIAVVCGATICAWTQGSLALRWPPRRRIPGALAGGLVMGFGAALAPGCNVGILLGSVPALAFHGLLVGAAMVGGFVLVTRVRRRLTGAA